LIATQLTTRSIDSDKIPFVDSPDHDSLLEHIKQSIKLSNLMLCFPGRQSSFIDDEVAMGFARDKPMLFVLDEAAAPFLPNTAKKGYPLFDREQIKTDGCVTLAAFCSYLAADAHSTIRLYLSVLNSLRGCAMTAVFVYAVMLALWPNLFNLYGEPKLLLVSVGVALFLVAYLAFFFKAVHRA
jgi:hypothetical protein